MKRTKQDLNNTFEGADWEIKLSTWFGSRGASRKLKTLRYVINFHRFSLSVIHLNLNCHLQCKAVIEIQ